MSMQILKQPIKIHSFLLKTPPQSILIIQLDFLSLYLSHMYTSTLTIHPPHMTKHILCLLLEWHYDMHAIGLRVG